MKTTLKCAVVAFTAFIATTTAFTQEWTKAQKEVWQVVENAWTNWKAENIEASTGYLHEKYQGWSNQSPLPVNKENVIKQFQEMKGFFKVDYFSLNPARIAVTENAAVVDYYYSYEATYTRGEKKELIEESGQYVEFYIKEDGKWMLLGDMTVAKEKGNTHKDKD
jgi:hypothetical protein